MTTTNKSIEQISIPKLLCLIFIPTLILTTVYVIAGFSGFMQNTIPSLLLFFLCAALILFPIEIGIVLSASKKEHARHNPMSWWKVFLYGSLLFGFAGIMSATLAPLENKLFAPISNQLAQITPAYFNWTNIENLKQYSQGIILLTCVGYFVFNVIVGPITEELFFRGYLTSKISRFGNWAPLIVTVLFSLYHLWLPFNNLFRIAVFFPAAWVAWKHKNIYIAMVFHCLCNLISSVSLIVSVYQG